MENLPIEITPELLPVIVLAVIQLFKRIPALHTIKQWYPVIGIGIAIAISFYMQFENPIMLGVVTGCVASKSYDILKKPAAGIVSNFSTAKAPPTPKTIKPKK